jgi:CubicO group peptidase (beta-lactamase class C family)
LQINGTNDARFSRLRDAFEICFSEHNEHGAAVAVMLDGRLVADLWAGHADKAKIKPWQRDTLVNVWSCTKGVMATAIAMLVEGGKLRYDAPIADVWPEFAANGKSKITLEQAMSHQSGINGLNQPISEEELCASTTFVEAIAAMAPNFEPGSTCSYHALTYGSLTAEPLRRVTGKSAGQFIADQIAGPLGADFFVGLPEAQDHRTAEIIEGPNATKWISDVLKSKYPQPVMNPTPRALAPNSRLWRAAEVPGGNGQGNARALAAIYGDIVSGKSKLIGSGALAEASRVRFRGLDESFGTDTVWGAGFRLEDVNAYGAQASLRTIGHGGWGGSIGFGDPGAQLGFSYVTNHMMGYDDGIDPRVRLMVEAVFDCL